MQDRLSDRTIPNFAKDYFFVDHGGELRETDRPEKDGLVRVYASGIGTVKFCGVGLLAGRVAWTVYTGDCPQDCLITHIDGDPTNCHKDNLIKWHQVGPPMVEIATVLTHAARKRVRQDWQQMKKEREAALLRNEHPDPKFPKYRRITPLGRDMNPVLDVTKSDCI